MSARTVLRPPAVATPGVEQSFAIPLDVERIKVKTPSNQDLRWSFISGQVAAGGGTVVDRVNGSDTRLVDLSPQTIYYGSVTPGTIIELEVFRKTPRDFGGPGFDSGFDSGFGPPDSVPGGSGEDSGFDFGFGPPEFG